MHWYSIDCSLLWTVKKNMNRWYKISAKCIIYMAQETRKYKLNWLNFGKNNEKQKRDFCGKHDSQSLWKSNFERNGDTAARKASTMTANDVKANKNVRLSERRGSERSTTRTTLPLLGEHHVAEVIWYVIWRFRNLRRIWEINMRK